MMNETGVDYCVQGNQLRAKSTVATGMRMMGATDPQTLIVFRK